MDGILLAPTMVPFPLTLAIARHVIRIALAIVPPIVGIVIGPGSLSGTLVGLVISVGK
jgi:hypothetical protein